MIKAYGVQVPPQLPPDLTFAYGGHPRHVLDYWRAQGATAPAPLIFFVHGGAWCEGDKALDTGYWKAKHFPEAGYALASINYRLVPHATVEQQAEDTAAALRALVGRAAELGFDAHRIVMMGHSAGAHLVALLGTDASWLQAAGLSLANIAGVVCIDGASYDAPLQIEATDPAWRQKFIDAFGTDPERQKRLSPVSHTDGRNAPDFLILHMPHRPDAGIIQAQDLGKRLRASGGKAKVCEIDTPLTTGHHELNQRMGEPGYGATQAVDDWLATVFPH